MRCWSCCGSPVNATAEPDCFRTDKNSSSRSECCWSRDPHLLLLDEPAAGMTDAETEYTAELFRTLAGKHSLMVVEHDMGFVETIADRVTVLHQGQVLAEGSLREVQANEQVIEVYLGR